jgi:hypothetical protein
MASVDGRIEVELSTEDRQRIDKLNETINHVSKLPEQLIKLADNMRVVASRIYDLGTDEARTHANEMRGAADIAVEWSYEIKKIVNDERQ